MANDFMSNEIQPTKAVEDTSKKSKMMMRQKDIKDLIAPSGIDTSDINFMKIHASTIERYARCMTLAI